MLTKAIIQSIDYTKNMCKVRIPLFENAARNVNIIEADAQINIVPGIYNSYKTGDIVFIGFEENKMELPVILGKLFVSTVAEASAQQGTLSGNSLAITDTARLPYSTLFDFSKIAQNEKLYTGLNTPKKLADGILNLRRSQVQKYQTVINVLATKVTRAGHGDKMVYNLYLKTSNDFAYSQGKSDEPLYRLCTALKNSQNDSGFIPLDLAVAEDDSISLALLQVQEMTATDLRLNMLVGGDLYTATKVDIVSVQSFAIYY